jgi:hypothetical protein
LETIVRSQNRPIHTTSNELTANSIPPEIVHKYAKRGYLGRKNERTLVSEVNYRSFTNSPQIPNISQTTVEDGLALLLSHFNEPLWPRTISTRATDGRQILVDGKEQALAYFKAAKYQDCRISAYPPNVDENISVVTRFQGIKKTTPLDLMILIDIDRCDFKTLQACKLALSVSLKNIKRLLGDDINPTVLWSGNGYHIYLVLNSNQVVLEYEKIFTGLTDQPSRKFLQFVEAFLSHGKSDKAHNNTVSFKNCMLRVPGSYNSKNGAQVTIVQIWDGRRKPEINYLLSDFCIYLANQKAIGLREQQLRPKTIYRQTGSSRIYTLQWIERLLRTPIADGRKYSIWHILVPYLINRRPLLEEQCTNVIVDWLDKCRQLSRLGFNANYRIRDAIKHVGTYGPVHPDKMKQEYPVLYDGLLKHGVLL